MKKTVLKVPHRESDGDRVNPKGVFKIGDEVRNTLSGSIGIVTAIPREVELRDCVIVRFRTPSDGICVPRSVLKHVTR